MLDLGCTGDCGYRVLSAMRAQQRTPQNTKEELERLVDRGSRTCRTQVVSYLSRKDKEWKRVEDRTIRNRTNTGRASAGNADTWLEAVQNKTKMWMDWRCILAIATAQQLRVGVCEWYAGLWCQKARFGDKGPLMPLALVGE